MGSPSDRDLIGQTLAGDQRAFAVLVHRYGRKVYVQIARKVRHPEDAEDLVQDTFVQAYTHLDQLKDGDRFGAWIRAIEESRVLMWHRRRFVQLRVEEMLETPSAGAISSKEQEEIQELKVVLRQALRTLTEAHRQVIVHHYLKGFTYLETAELLHLEVGTVRSRLQKARHRLREEIASMNDEDVRPQTFELMRDDFEALRWATVFVSRDETRPILQGVYIDLGGKMISCDGHRLLVWPSERLSGIAAPVLMGPLLDVEIPRANRGTLSIGAQDAIIRAPGKEDRTIPIMEKAYVEYEKVIPTDWAICVKVTTGALLDAIDLIADHILPRHPADPKGVWVYRPVVEIRLSASDQMLSLITTRDMGYELKEDPKVPRSRDETPDWTFITSIQAQVEMGRSEEVFRIGVNHTYLKDTVRALEMNRDEVAEIRFIAPDRAILVSPLQHPDRKSLLMPVRLRAATDSEGPG